MKEFWSDRIRSLTPYTPGEQPKDRQFIKLNTNENPYPPAPGALRAIRDNADASLRLYSDPEASALRRALAEAYGLTPEQVFVGNGSDEVLAFAFQAFFSPGAEIAAPDITYSFYPVYANLFDIRYRTVPLNEDFTVPVERFCGGCDGVVIANPNAPTGMELSQAEIRRILEANPDVAVIVDEAYVDFGAASAVGLIDEYPNLLVVQTFSKSRALAGLRVGFAFGNENLIQALNCVKNSINSYTLDRLALAGAAASVADGDYFAAQCARVIATRERTAEGLRALGFVVYPSKANFIFITHPAVPAKTLFAGLREKGILVRYFDLPRIDNCLRVSIGTDADMDAFLAAAAELTKEG
ncbi:MAG: histidinol-phosphate transaminase [Oscillospiraceae bacterium]|nr:histidinol-phosphate transaminase [Oscillospiraceae bacterium]